MSKYHPLSTQLSFIKRTVGLGLAFAALTWLGGCAHPIVITPQLQMLETKSGPISTKNAGYFIAKSDREKQVITPGGGGDKVSYYPYKELEPALYKALTGVFNRVYTLESLDNKDYIAKQNIKFIFVPQIETASSSTGILTWPPTDFIVSIDCSAMDESGKILWKTKVNESGHAEYQEFLGDFALSAKRASEKAFKVFQDALVNAPEFLHGK